MTSSNTEIICNNRTTTGSMATDSERIECPQCQALQSRLRHLISELKKTQQMFAASRGGIQKAEAMLAELVLKD